MNSKIIGTGLLAISALVTMSSAHAEGLYIFGNVSSTTLEHSIERSLEAGAPTLPVPDAGGISIASETDFGASTGVGYRVNLNEDVFLGVEGFYKTHSNSSKNVNGVLITEIELDSSYGLSLLAGVNVTDKFSVYAHGGFSELEFDIDNSYTFAPPVSDRSEKESGFTFGLGADYKLNDNYSVYTQYSQTNDVDFDGIPEVAGGTGRVNPNELDLTELTLGLRYSF